MTSDNITVIMKPTNQCNLRCKYCYHADNGYDKEKMTDQVLEKAIAVTAPFFKRVEYNWHGGEPLIMGLDFYERVLYYQKKYRQGPEHHIINTMQTNGTLITQETAEFIKKYGFGIGLSLTDLLMIRHVEKQIIRLMRMIYLNKSIKDTEPFPLLGHIIFII